ncbi:MAG: hypothetical protein HY272_01940 [Gammaproteobacteria bacterium]|nr:hypothetical protein [Gammaproteobacteria bacterium]
MHANGIKETTITAGNGTVTLSAVTGFVRFSDAFAINSLCSYAIHDGNNWEWGLGIVLAGNTLQRYKVLATYASGVYNSATPTKLVLSGASADVICTAIAGNFNATMPAVSSNIVGAFVASEHIAGFGGATVTLSANRLYATPYLTQGMIAVNSLICYVSTAAAGKKIRIGLYDIDAFSGYPNNLILESTDIDAGTTGKKTSTFSTKRLNPGWYYAAAISDGVPAMLASPASAASFSPVGMDASLLQNTYTYKDVSAGWLALPDPVSPPFMFSNSNSPLIVLGSA